MEEIIEEIKSVARTYPDIDRIFIADGDALIIKTSHLIRIIEEIKNSFKKCKRIGIYASPKSVHLKSLEELTTLRENGLDIAYLGLESGSDKVLDKVNKGDTREGIIKAGRKLKEAGIKVSLTVISGLGGADLYREHAIETAKAVNEINPEFLGLLTLMIEPGTRLYDEVRNGSFKLLSPNEIAVETLMILENLDSPGTVFRSNHASNYIPLKGTLNQDITSLLKQIRRAMEDGSYKDELYRRLWFQLFNKVYLRVKLDRKYK